MPIHDKEILEQMATADQLARDVFDTLSGQGYDPRIIISSILQCGVINPAIENFDEGDFEYLFQLMQGFINDYRSVVPANTC